MVLCIALGQFYCAKFVCYTNVKINKYNNYIYICILQIIVLLVKRKSIERECLMPKNKILRGRHEYIYRT